MRSFGPCLAALAALVACGCLPRIPTGALAPELPPAKVPAQVCRLTGERSARPLLVGVDRFSFARYESVIGSVLVTRPGPSGKPERLVIDPAFGTTVREDVARTGPFFKLALGDGRSKRPLVESMDAAGIDPYAVQWIALTHAHWDHTGAIRDLTRAKVLLTKDELKASWNLKKYVDHGVMPHHLEVPEGRFVAFEFDGPPLLGFSASHDLFGDGSVIALPTPGHTPGSASYLVRGEGGKSWLFIGDATWTVEGLKLPAHKNPLVSALFDRDARVLAQTLGQLHAVQAQRPEVLVVPAHDFAAFGQLPECAKAP